MVSKKILISFFKIFIFVLFFSIDIQAQQNKVLQFLKQTDWPQEVVAQFEKHPILIDRFMNLKGSDQDIKFFVAQFDAISALDYLQTNYWLDKKDFVLRIQDFLKKPDFNHLKINFKTEATKTAAAILHSHVSKSLKEVPPYLFHWTGQNTLDLMKSFNPNPSLVPLRFIKSTHYIAQSVPELSGQPGLFAWIHPVTGMAVSETERYTDFTESHPARLMVMIPDPASRVLELSTTENFTPQYFGNSLKNYDLIFHRHLRSDGTLSYQEWVVINPKAILDFSAEPNVTQAFMERELDHLKNKEFQYDEKIRLSQYHDRKFMKEQILNFLRKPNFTQRIKNQIKSYFDSNSGYDPISAPAIREMTSFKLDMSKMDSYLRRVTLHKDNILKNSCQNLFL